MIQRQTKLRQKTFGKSGTRRIVPGQYLAVEPKGRTVMISARRQSSSTSSIAIPPRISLLEAHKDYAIIHHIVALDCRVRKSDVRRPQRGSGPTPSEPTRPDVRRSILLV